MGGRGGVTGQRSRIPEIYDPLDQFQSVIEPYTSFETILYAESHQGTRASAKVFSRQKVIGTFGKSGIAHPGNPRILGKKFGYAAPIFYLPLYTQRYCFDPLQQKERTERRQCRPCHALIDAPAPRDIGGCPEAIHVNQSVI